MRILLIAPTTNLPLVPAEVSDIANLKNLQVKQKQGEVRRQDLVREISSSEYDILWLATHGDEKSFALSDSRVEYRSLVALLRPAHIKLVFLNTCSSLAAAQQFAEGAGVDVVATIAEVPDVEAYERGTLFALWLSRGQSFRSAFDLSKAGAGDVYRYVSGGGEPVPQQQHGPANGVDYGRRLDKIEIVLFGDDRVGVKSIKTITTHLADKVGSLEAIIERLTHENAMLRDQIAEGKQILQRERLHVEGKMKGLEEALAEHTEMLQSRGLWYIDYVAPTVSIGVLLFMIYLAVIINGLSR